MMMALVPETSTPASKLSDEMVIDLVIVTPPNPPGSRTLISPPVAVFEMAPAKVLHGAVRLQGLASSPTPETQVRVACAWAGAAATAMTTRHANATTSFLTMVTGSLLRLGCDRERAILAKTGSLVPKGGWIASGGGELPRASRRPAARICRL